ncbi:type II toxin-antitoxin system RelE/ParE family toxin [Brenneria tiliae]|uniref:type II toxin-antitoxin system RelE/ParE family toxin n=1 Tax=Brenneria tiliae TaxID=2914984 RepID=UPI002014F0DE|nr:type II toxin-antitoxin system RelE/ParE family toxin [Brenneria tiliae]MCL2898317.1 type II toxin-antitoxin system RelE/ParE family toxin [Brenneria tiliae]MCL2902667.1 type II toxin-antitoxin system RelE/ParE family toxin [Brenneria tiliae]
MPRYKLTDDAREDVREIKKHSLKQFGSRVTREYRLGMQICMQRLAENRQRVSDNIEALDIQGLRYFPYMNHAIYYLFAPHGITIVGVLHQSRLPNILHQRRL